MKVYVCLRDAARMHHMETHAALKCSKCGNVVSYKNIELSCDVAVCDCGAISVGTTHAHWCSTK